MATSIIFIILACIVSVFVVMPIVQASVRRGKAGALDSNHRASELEERKKTIYSAIKDIEFDYQMGKISEEDFKELRQQYKDEAIGILKKLDKAQMKQMKPAAQQQTQGKGAAKMEKTAQFCWVCGTGIAENDKFCPNCGTNLSEA